MRPGLLANREVAGGFELLQAVRRHFHHDVEPTRQHLGDARVGVGDRPEDDRLELRRPVPIVFVPGRHHFRVRLPFGEFVGAGAGGIAAEILAVFLHRRGRDDQAGRIGEIGQERRVGGVELELDRRRIDRRHFLDGGEEESERKGSGVGEGMIFLQHPVEVELDRFGIERRAVVEFDALPQLESVGLAVLGDGPALGQRRFDLQRAVLIADQPVIEIHQDAEIVDRRHRLRIERFRLGDLTNHQNIGRRLGDRRRGQCQCHQCRGDRRGQPFSHNALPCLSIFHN